MSNMTRRYWCEDCQRSHVVIRPQAAYRERWTEHLKDGLEAMVGVLVLVLLAAFLVLLGVALS